MARPGGRQKTCRPKQLSRQSEPPPFPQPPAFICQGGSAHHLAELRGARLQAVCCSTRCEQLGAA
eukprot:9270382-Pyramimonas_sp.AAC.1